MKNTFSKVLFCGIVASSVILVNCQKSPNRGVKAQAGGVAPSDKLVGSATADGTDPKLVAKTTCDMAFIGKKNDLMSFINVSNEKKAQVLKPKTAIADSDKKDFAAINENLAKLCAATIADLDKTAEKACIDNGGSVKVSGQKTPTYSVNSLNATCDMITASYKEVSGVASSREVERTKASEAAKAKTGDALVGTKYTVATSELADLITVASDKPTNMIQDGKIIGSIDFAEIKKTDSSICGFTAAGGTITKDTELAVVNNKVVGVDSRNNRTLVELNLSANSKTDSVSTFITMKCSLVGTNVVEEFNKVFGDNLVAKTEVKSGTTADTNSTEATTTATTTTPAATTTTTPSETVVIPSTPSAATAKTASTSVTKMDAAVQADLSKKLPIDPSIANTPLNVSVAAPATKTEEKAQAADPVKTDDSDAAKAQVLPEAKVEASAEAKPEVAAVTEKASVNKVAAASKAEVKVEQKTVTATAAKDQSGSSVDFATASADTVKELKIFGQLQQDLLKIASADYNALAGISKLSSPLKYLAASSKYDASNLRLKQVNAIVAGLNEEYAAIKLISAAKTDAEETSSIEAFTAAHDKVLKAKEARFKTEKEAAAVVSAGDMINQD